MGTRWAAAFISLHPWGRVTIIWACEMLQAARTCLHDVIVSEITEVHYYPFRATIILSRAHTLNVSLRRTPAGPMGIGDVVPNVKRELELIIRFIQSTPPG
eukprot:932771-Pelagomonas_calceolata.AAC.5